MTTDALARTVNIYAGMAGKASSRPLHKKEKDGEADGSEPTEGNYRNQSLPDF